MRAIPDSERTRDKRRAVLVAASRAFRAGGFHGTSMRDIAAALGMTVSNLYYYFDSKEDLLAFCQEDTLDRLLELVGWAEAQALPADQRLFLVLVGHVVCLNEAVPGSLAHLELEELPEERRAPLIARRDRYERRLRELVREGVQAGRLRAADPKVAVLAMLGGLNWTVRWFRPGGGKTPLALGRQMAEQFVRGLLADGVTFLAPDLAIPPFAGAASGVETRNG